MSQLSPEAHATIAELDHIIEKLKLEKKAGDERIQTLKRQNIQLKAEVQEVRSFAEELRVRAYDAVNAEVDVREKMLDLIYEQLQGAIAMSHEQKHAMKEILNSHRAPKISPTPASS